MQGVPPGGPSVPPSGTPLRSAPSSRRPASAPRCVLHARQCARKPPLAAPSSLAAAAPAIPPAAQFAPPCPHSALAPPPQCYSCWGIDSDRMAAYYDLVLDLERSLEGGMVAHHMADPDEFQVRAHAHACVGVCVCVCVCMHACCLEESAGPRQGCAHLLWVSVRARASPVPWLTLAVLAPRPRPC
jgi:hypothetical protein